MAETPLTPALRRKIMVMFASSDVHEAAEIITLLCGEHLIADGGVDLVERVRAAVLKLSEGRLERLYCATQLAYEDFRDALVAADFADDLDAHLTWLAP